MTLHIAFKQASRLLTPATSLAAKRSLSVSGFRAYNDKEVANELTFNKEDEMAMRRLLAKVKAQAEAAEPAAAAEYQQEEIAALKSIIDKYKMKAHDVEALIAWRRSTDF